MPISQATILAIYGDLCDLVEKVETVANHATQLSFFAEQDQDPASLQAQVRNLLSSAKSAQQDAITHIMAEAPEIEVNPITGRLDE